MPCLVSGGGFLYLTNSHLHSVPQVFINDWWDNIFCPVVMVLIDSDVFLITENLSEAALAETCSLGSLVATVVERSTYLGYRLTVCIHLKCFPDDRSSGFINYQFLIYSLVPQRNSPTDGVVFHGRLPHAPVDLL